MSPVSTNVTALPLSPTADWQAQARAARISTAALLAELGLKPTDFAAGVIDNPDFPISAPPHYRSLIRRGDPADPLLLQVLALGQEALPQPDRFTDPLQEADYRAAPGVLRKYRSRALLIASGACAIHCRYCFRRHTDYGAAMLTRSGESQALALIGGDADIEEVILSGGDPLSLTDARLTALVAAIAAIPHVTTLRLHSRTLMVIPDRVTPALVDLLRSTRLSVVLVTHSNHEREISSEVAASLGRLRAAGVTLLNQSVLLAGVNDAASTIAAHCRRLFAAGVLPYYLHLTDPVDGSAHYDVDETRARAIETELRGLLPGYLVPRIVREVPGEAAKTPLWALPGS